MDFDLQTFRVENTPCTVFYIPNFITEDEERMLLSRVYNAPKTKWTVLSHRRLQNWGGLPGPKGMIGEDLPEWLSTYAKKISGIGAFEGKVPNHVLVNEYQPGQGIMPHEDGPAFFPTVSTISLGSHTLLDFYYHLDAAKVDGSEHAQGQSRADASSNNTDQMSQQSESSEKSQLSEPKKSTQHSERSSGDYASSPSSEAGPRSGAADGCGTSLDSRHFLSLLLQPRSLVLLQDDMYKVHLHGIKDVSEDVVTDRVANLSVVPEVKVGDVLQRKTRVSLTIRYVQKVLKSKLIFGKR